MFSSFFINRPVFATVLSLVIVILGAVAAPTLPIAQYPNVTPPLVSITAAYPGASGQLVSDTVATPIEQQINGVDEMLYMESYGTADGSMTLNVTFDIGTDPNTDQVLAQNRVSLALPSVPTLVQQQGVVVKKMNPSILLAVQVYSPDGSRDTNFLSNYFKIQIYDELLRIYGVGQVNILGVRDYSMRVWLDPEKLTVRNLTAIDVINALQEQNVQVAAGVLGQPPVPTGQEQVYLVNTLGRLSDISQFENVVVATDSAGTPIYIRDVGWVELGAQQYSQDCTLDGKPAIAAAVFQLPGTNALSVAELIRHKMEELKPRFPPGVDYAVYYDTTEFIEEAALEVVWTLIESSFLVSLVIFIFLQNWRSAIVPIVSLPVSIIGAFAIMAAAGFSFNNLSLFGLVLAIGIVVDDAIVVVENVERNLEKGLSPMRAAHVAMREIAGAVLAVTLVLSFVFIPAAFITGVTGEFYRQFALTIAGSTLISGLNSLTLSPALCAILLKPKHAHGAAGSHGAGGGHGEYLPVAFYVAFFGVIGAGLTVVLFDHAKLEVNPLRSLVHAFEHTHDWQRTALIAAVGFGVVGAVGGLLYFVWERALGIFFAGFNAMFDLGTKLYGRVVAALLRTAVLSLVVYGVLLFATGYLLNRVPVGFIPELDKGYLFVNVKLPDGASLERTRAVVEEVAARCRTEEAVGHTIGVSGFSLVASANSTSMGTIICTLKPFEERLRLDLRADHVAARLRQKLKDIEAGIVAVFGAPPIDGLGRAGGFKLQIQDRGDLGPQALESAAQTLVRAANAQPGLIGVTSTYSAQLPQLFLDIDRTQAKARGVKLSDVFTTLQTYVGSIYVNQINLFGRTWQVNVQAESGFRLSEEDVGRLRVRNSSGEMVPISAIAKVERISGPEKVARYNMYRSADVLGGNLPTMSSGQVIEVMDALAKQHLPPSMTIEWTDLTFQQIRAGNTSIYVFMFGGLMVYLVLAAQYESYALPFSVVLIVPMCIMCALFGVLSRHMANDIFTQVGLLVLVGLASKNAILIVEFAKQRREEGEDRFKAALDAAVARLRPILMTSACFVHMVPLYFSLGAGAEMRQSLGTAVLWGAFGVTLFGIFLTPVFYYVVDWLVGDAFARKIGGDEAGESGEPTHAIEGPAKPHA